MACRLGIRAFALAAAILGLAPSLQSGGGIAFAQSAAGLRTSAITPAQRTDLRLNERIKLGSVRAPTASRNQTGIIIGVAAGFVGGWLVGRSQGDNFNTPIMMTFAAIGAVLGLAFSPHR